MKPCPNCRYVPNLTNRQLLKLYAKHFGDMPVWSMLERGWLGDVDRESVSEIEQALNKFFECEEGEDWRAALERPMRARVCNLSPNKDVKETSAVTN